MYSRGGVVATSFKVARRTRRDDERSFSILKHTTSIFYPYYISYSQKEIFMSSIPQKTELENVNFCPCQNFFVHFLEELKKQTKCPFKIN